MILVLLAVLGALAFTITGGAATFVQSNHINFRLEGCKNDGTITFPSSGPFVCPDTAYTTGNLGKGWNELDLVPHRLTTQAGTQAGTTTSYNVVIAADYFNGGTKFGYDIISAPVVNAAKSDSSCSVTATAQAISVAGVTGGAQQTIYRTLSIDQDPGTTCVFDYYQRLALGAHNFSGSSLQSYMFEKDDFSTGKRTLSIPVNEIAPQELSKDMTATQGSDHVWTIKKEPSAAHVDFTNTCDPNASLSAPVTIKVTWEKLPADPTGPITVVTHVYATNPAARVVTLSLTDDIRSGTTVLDTATVGPTDLPANSVTLVLTHTTTVPSGTTSLNDIATGTYTDKVTNIPIPGSTTATASATVQLSGLEGNPTATIDDVESISGSGLSYSADSFTGASGAFDPAYVPGTATTGDVGWMSDTQDDGDSVTFSKTIYATSASSGSGELDDTATLTGSDGFSASADADITISTDAKVKLTIKKTIPNVLTGSETQSFTFHVFDSSDNEVATPTLNFAAGDTEKSTTIGNLAPDTYTVKEDTASGWNPADDQDVDLNLPTCSGEADFDNNLGPADAKAVKVTNPAGSEAGWSMTLNGPGTPAGGETVVTDANGDAPFATSLQEGSYTISETGKSGWDQTGTSGDCSFTVNFPADAGRHFVCTITNTQRGHIIVKKLTNPAGSSQSFEFDPSYSATNFFLTDTQTSDSGALIPGTYSVAEVNIASGWDLTSSSCSDGSAVSAISLQAGETVTCTFNNRQRGKVKVIKTVSGAAPTGTQSFTFQLRQGATTISSGTTLESLTANAGNGGIITFTTLLVPGSTYQLCEIVMPGWSTTLGTFVPDSFIPPDGVAPNPNVDNSILCINFTVTAGQTKEFAVDNTPPPGGRALTIGFWKNWASCTTSSSSKKPVLDQTLAKADVIPDGQGKPGIVVSASSGTYSLFGVTYYLVLHGSTSTPNSAPDCAKAVNLLNKATVTGAKKSASDPLFNMTAQLVGAELNYAAGAGKNGSTTTNITSAVRLNGKYGFNGNTYSPKLTSADATKANCLATQLDNYNNDRAVSTCP
ncbi:MAG TPA: hypothetical protein VGJ27_08640 [Gaiellaceae bacterium]